MVYLAATVKQRGGLVRMHEQEIGYNSCSLCPHACLVNRSQGELGICGESDTMRIAWVGLHRGEEPPLIGTHGSGTIFFSGCPLHCTYCQNCQISGRNSTFGIPISHEQFVETLLDLEAMGAANANLVTGTHFIPAIRDGIIEARTRGFSLPVVWNSSGFESIEALKMIDSLVDTYLIDLKTLDRSVAATFCGTAKYSDYIETVITFICERHPETYETEQGIRGTIVRHLLFPGTLHATEEVLRWYARNAKDAAWLSLMVQFVPPEGNVMLPEVDEQTYAYLVDLLEELEIEHGFMQELGDNIPWIPDFTRANPFPESFADPLPSFLSLKEAWQQHATQW